MPSTPIAPERARRDYRGRQRRRLVMLVTLPGLILGTVSVTAAYSAGLLNRKAVSCQPKLVAAPARDGFTIKLQNSNETPGEGAEVAKGLSARGFVISSVSNAPDDIYVTRSATVYHGPKGRDEALLVAAQIPGARAWDDGRSGSNVDLIIGYGFTGLSYVPPPPPPLPSEIAVNVYNTTYRAGLASQVGDALRQRSFDVEAVGNDPLMSFLPDEVAVIRHGVDGQDAADVLLQHIPDARLVSDGRSDGSLDLVLGNGYAALTPRAEVPKPAPRPSPKPEMIARPCS
ncbi:MAG: LytR C-terminal domain-containing protein [Nostocoides sp.]|uniref:LytR C-terminal domain-containing protein n=1 Tax=Nostocoides sp. TaxID=1917966 RepID=UPI003BE7B93F